MGGNRNREEERAGRRQRRFTHRVLWQVTVNPSEA
jgi:hypothetical protein